MRQHQTPSLADEITAQVFRNSRLSQCQRAGPARRPRVREWEHVGFYDIGRARSPVGPGCAVWRGNCIRGARLDHFLGAGRVRFTRVHEWDAREIPRFPPSKRSVVTKLAAVVIRIYQPTSARYATVESRLCSSVARMQLR